MTKVIRFKPYFDKKYLQNLYNPAKRNQSKSKKKGKVIKMEKKLV